MNDNECTGFPVFEHCFEEQGTALKGWYQCRLCPVRVVRKTAGGSLKAMMSRLKEDWNVTHPKAKI